MATTTAKTIKKLMIDRDVTGVQIAKVAGCTRQNVYQIVAGRYKTPRIRQILADALGIQVSDLWPEERPRKKAA